MQKALSRTLQLYLRQPITEIKIQGRSYDYTFDDHRRLVAAKYSSSVKDEDFSTEYTYDEVANPRTVMRKGVVSVNSSGEASYGILDNLSYDYKGNQVQHIQQSGTGVDFYGRTGYALAHGDYTWNEAGLLNSDSSRGIQSTTYNHLGLPTQQKVSVNSLMAQTVMYTYNCEGQLLSVGGSKPRYYSGSRIFEGTDLLYSYFPGGYFDATGAAHYTHADYQGSIIAVTDSTGRVVQTTNYYPYGEPWREPTGQPMLFSGKERTTLSDYHFDPRNYVAAGQFWTAPDRKASDFTRLSPYSYCAGNPIGYNDPTGNAFQVIGTAIIGALIGGATDYYVQVFAYEWVGDLSYEEAKKNVDYTSVATSAISGALGGVFASISRIPAFVNRANTIKNAITATNVALEVADAAVDYTENDGFSAVGYDPNSKSLDKVGLDLVGSIVSARVSSGAIKVARQQALENVSLPTFKTATQAEQAQYIGLKSLVDGKIFEVGAQFHNNYLTKSFILFLNKKLEDNKGNE